MSIVMKASDFIAKLKDIATNYNTLYVMGCFGAPMNSKNKTRYCNNHDYNKQASRTSKIQAASTDTFGFDCVCLIKGVLWGWNGDKNKTYGGATYKANGVPDVSADGMIKLCTDISTDFTNIEPGEAVWTTGHIGIYIGDGLVVECTPAWKNKVQITACNCTKASYNTRNWKKHGKLPYIEYDVKESSSVTMEENKEVSSTTPTSAAEDLKLKQIKKSSKGTAVKVWQAIVGVDVDGNFGPDTLNATLAFQKEAFPNDEKEWDGIVGNKTWSAGLKSIM